MGLTPITKVKCEVTKPTLVEILKSRFILVTMRHTCYKLFIRRSPSLR